MADPAHKNLAYGPAPALFVVAPHDDAVPRPQMNVGDTGTAKVSFTDETGADMKIVESTWTSMSPAVTINPLVPAASDQPPADPATTNLTATALGRAPIRVIVVTETGKPAVGKIDVTVTPAKAK